MQWPHHDTVLLAEWSPRITPFLHHFFATVTLKADFVCHSCCFIPLGPPYMQPHMMAYISKNTTCRENGQLVQLVQNWCILELPPSAVDCALPDWLDRLLFSTASYLACNVIEGTVRVSEIISFCKYRLETLEHASFQLLYWTSFLRTIHSSLPQWQIKY